MSDERMCGVCGFPVSAHAPGPVGSLVNRRCGALAEVQARAAGVREEYGEPWGEVSYSPEQDE